MYDFPLVDGLYQGDVISQFQFKLPAIGGGDFVSVAMIISQTCDIGNKTAVHVCPVITFREAYERIESLDDEEKKLKARSSLGSIRSTKQNTYSAFYLPPVQTPQFVVEEAYVDFERIFLADEDDISQDNRLYSLSDRGRHMLAYALSNYYGRPFL